MSDQPQAAPTLPPGVVDLTAETELVGGLLRTPRLVPRVVAVVESDEAFTDRRLAAAYRAIITAFNSGDEPTASRVRDLMRSAGDTDPNLVGWVADLLQSAPPLPNDVIAAAEKVGDLAVKRRLSDDVSRTFAKIIDVSSSGTDAVSAIHALATSAVMQAPMGESIHTGTAALLETIEKIEELGKREGLPGLSTGSRDLDEVLQGLRPGQVVVVGGRPSVGKSIVATDFVRAAAKQGVGTMMFTLEMTRHEVTERIISAEGPVDARHIRTGQLSDHEWDKISRVTSTFPHDKIAIVDEGGLSVGQITALATQQARIWEAAQIQPGLIVIDYLQIMQTRNSGSRQQDLGEITVQVKALAKRLEVPIVLLSQVGRGAEQHTDKRPGLSDLRESGDIEANADIAILLHRPDFYDKEDRPGEIDYIIAKNRGGPTKTITRTHQFRFSRVDEYANDYGD